MITLRARLFFTNLIVATVGIAVIGIALDQVMEHRTVDDLRARLAAEARSVRAIIARGGVAQPMIVELGRASGSRITVISTAGVVLADSERDPATMENHAQRPEIRAALHGRTGSHQRVSDTLHEPFLYVAVPVLDGVIVRTALPAARVSASRTVIRRAMALSGLGAAIFAAIVAAFAARAVARPLDQIGDQIARVARGEFPSVPRHGPAELRSLAHAVNRMAGELDQRLSDVRAEGALREQILAAMDEAVLLAEDGWIVYANAAATRLLGEHRTVPAFVPQPPRGETISADVTIYHPARRDLQIVAADLSPSRMLIVARDVTDARRVESMRRDFVANASHEMKTPVAAILATAETLAHAIDEDPQSARRFARTLVADAARLSALVSDLLSLARLEQPLEAGARIDFSTLVRDVTGGERPRCETAGIALVLNVADGVAVSGRDEDLRLLVRNLVDNAIRYTPAGGDVRVDLAARAGSAVLRVADSGAGIAQADLPRIFERFFRVDPARARETGGTGLGLAIVRHVAESHLGTVSVESELGRGSIFTVQMPCR